MWSPMGVLSKAAWPDKREGGVPALPLSLTRLPLSLSHSPSRYTGPGVWPEAGRSTVWASKPEIAQGKTNQGAEA